MHKRVCLLMFLFLGLLISGCRPGFSTESNLPTPVEIRVVTSTQTRTLTAQDESFAEATSSLAALLGSVEHRARTLFTPARFATEIEPLTHIYIRLPEETLLRSRDLEWQAAELVIVSPGEAMVLARTPSSEDWSVYLPADPNQLEEFMARLTQPSP